MINDSVQKSSDFISEINLPNDQKNRPFSNMDSHSIKEH